MSKCPIINDCEFYTKDCGICLYDNGYWCKHLDQKIIDVRDAVDFWGEMQC